MLQMLVVDFRSVYVATGKFVFANTNRNTATAAHKVPRYLPHIQRRNEQYCPLGDRCFKKNPLKNSGYLFKKQQSNDMLVIAPVPHPDFPLGAYLL